MVVFFFFEDTGFDLFFDGYAAFLAGDVWDVCSTLDRGTGSTGWISSSAEEVVHGLGR